MNSRNILKIILSTTLIIASAVGFFMIYVISKYRLTAVDNSFKLMIVSAVLMALYFLIDLVCAIASIVQRSARKIAGIRPFVQISVIIAFVQIFIAAINGILLDHLITIVLCGIIIPEVYFLFSKMIIARR